MKISNYIRNGKGRGLRLFCVVALLLSILYGVAIYFSGMKLTKLPQVDEFIRSVPVFSVKDGVIQDKNIRWHVAIPGGTSSLSIVIDTSKPDLELPVADGIYLTSQYVYVVSQHGMSADRTQLQGSFDVNPEYLHARLQAYVATFALVIAVVSFVSSFVALLLLVGLSAILGLIFRARLGNGRVWRGAVVAWFIGLLLNFLASFVVGGSLIPLLIFFLCAVMNVIWLKKTSD